MRERDIVALVAGLLEATHEGRREGDAILAWPRTAASGLDSAAWNPKGEAAFRLAGRLNLFRGRRIGRSR